MKHALLILLALPLAAAPITNIPVDFSIGGSNVSRGSNGGYFVSLQGDQTAILRLDQYVTGLRIDANNLPFQHGTGICLRTAAEDFGCYGSGADFKGAIEIQSRYQFSEVEMYTKPEFREGTRRNILERFIISTVESFTKPTPPIPGVPVHVPEPSGLWEVTLAAGAVVGLLWRRK